MTDHPAVDAMAFGEDTLARLRDMEEVRIETRRAVDGPTHRTIIWVVVDAHGRVLIRSVRGPRGRWYREALAAPDCVLWIGREPLPVRVELAADADRVATTTTGLVAKYAGSPSLPSMIREDVLPTTLQLLPR